jgi:pyrroline-5-carboxylate reductase
MKEFTDRIGIIGFGNMGKAIFSGLIKSGNFAEKDFISSNGGADNIKVAKEASIIIVSVKPAVINEILDQIKPYITKEKLLISVAAGVKINAIKDVLGLNYPVVRVMPNICAEVGKSISCWMKSAEVSDSQTEKVKYILSSIGEEVMIDDEKFFSEITVIAGSGPAYFLYIAELLSNYADKIKLNPDLAKKLIKQTFLGAALMFAESDKDAKKIREEITSKGGTTEAVFSVLSENEFGSAFLKGLEAGHKRSSNL